MQEHSELVSKSATRQSNPTVAKAMLSAFAERGVRAAFGIPGGLISPIFDALADVKEIDLVMTRHEGMAAFAAMGHAVATGMPALVLTTGGPGITNALTGIAAAFVEELPLIAIAGEVPTSASGRGALQDSSSSGIDSVAMLRTVTRWSARVDSASQALGAVEQALQIATGPRPGPVFLSIPLDVGNHRAQPTPVSPALVEPHPNGRPDPIACAEIVACLLRARRPLLVVGNGARAASGELRELAERLRCPIVTTPHAKGIFPDSHPLHLGGIGIGGHPSVSAYLANPPDVVCIIGSRLGDYATNGWSIPLTGTEATYQIDREPRALGRNYPLTLGVVGDAALALRAMIAKLPTDSAPPFRDSYGIRRVNESSLVDDSTPLKPGRVLRALQEAFPEAFWTCDQGEHCAYALHYLQIDRADEFRTMVGLASMGSGIGLAIGARHADRSRQVIGVCGDGGFAMHAGDVLSCVAHGIDVMLVVMNDGRWNMVHHGFQSVFGRRPDGLPSDVADLAGVAESFGAIGVRISEPEHLRPEYLRSLASQGRPVILDVRFDSALALSAESRSASLRDYATGGT
jgi:acetolactate synthase I/II/III large subunit